MKNKKGFLLGYKTWGFLNTIFRITVYSKYSRATYQYRFQNLMRIYTVKFTVTLSQDVILVYCNTLCCDMLPSGGQMYMLQNGNGIQYNSNVLGLKEFLKLVCLLFSLFAYQDCIYLIYKNTVKTLKLRNIIYSLSYSCFLFGDQN